MSVKVAVRVRPFNTRENELNSQLCIDMQGSQTIIYDNKKEPPEPRPFNFDYSFWSHDGFETQPDGRMVQTNERYADQQIVYNTVGEEILDNAWQGYNCTLFAYGQTGSGKSYSMIGYGVNVGIVPISCEEIFKRIDKNDNPNKEYEVSFSMLEIYSEKVQDLLISVDQRPKKGLEIREHQKHGVFVVGLTKKLVESFAEIEDLMEVGNKHKTIASTEMNASSSRSHTIITIEFLQREKFDKQTAEKLSKINLVDLAGSEKVGKTKVTGDRLKEANTINLSLTNLGRCIEALAKVDPTKTGKQQVHVPFRSSSLTRILQNALGGNSKTLMICAVSPATDNYEESLRTLKYADQAKKIKCHAVINESEQDKMIRELKEENEKLKQQLSVLGNPEGKLLMDENYLSQMKEMEAQIQENAMFMEQSQKQTKVVFKKHSMTKFFETIPHLLNLNEDPMLNKKVQYGVDEVITHIGKKSGNPLPQIILGGPIKPNHAIIHNENNELSIEPFEKSNGEQIFINGKNCFEKTALHNNDRLILGPNLFFLVKIPGAEQDDQQDKELDWEFASKEYMIKLEQLQEEKQKEEIKIIEDKIQNEKMQLESELKEQQRKYEEIILSLKQQQKSDEENQRLIAEQNLKTEMASLQAAKTKKIEESEKELKAMRRPEHLHSKYQQLYLERKIQETYPQILECNLIAQELKRNVSFMLKLSYEHTDDPQVVNPGTHSPQNLKLRIEVTNHEQGMVFIWDKKKFLNRYYMIKDLLDQYYENNMPPQLDLSLDPFYDPPEPHLIGQSFLKIMSLAYQLDNPSKLKIYGDQGEEGLLEVNLIPTDVKGEKHYGEDNDGNESDDDENFVENPTDLLGRPMYYKVFIKQAIFQELKWKDVFIQYKIIEDSDLKLVSYQTEQFTGKSLNPIFNYEHFHKYDNVDQSFIECLLQQTLCFNIFGQQDLIPVIQKKMQKQQSAMFEIQSTLVEEKKQPNIIIPESKTQPVVEKVPQKSYKEAKKELQKKNKKEKDCVIF